ncbi:carboxypeptidase s1 [Colletotrichum plurivorum]|uniref:Carboxypeptidase n=1 Tax=Colletotrichum plurivorum TaxID=2175906 RepID=A0A8H6KE45_9PEZI|nr:carboxypeptidase s1 [Colletotrichum plurivorum]
MVASASLVLGGLIGLAAAQFPPEPEGITLLKSKFHENVTISYKEPGICETTPGVRSYAGYVHLPPGTLDAETQEYPINTFFWFFEARKAPENAPLAIWLNGGPGGSSIMGLLEENGPCLVNADSKTTRLNPWSWSNEVNLLYLDQPNQVGFSYDVPTNVTAHDDENGLFGVFPADFDKVPVPEPGNWTYRYGTASSQNVSRTAHTTAQAAHALWHFAQTWFFEFPFYKPADDRVSLWAESYGGHYAPGILKHFQTQNELIANGTSPEKDAQYIHLDTLGIVNGLIDFVLQAETWITFPYNNTYGIQVFNESLHEELMTNWTRPGGCREQVIECQEALKKHGPMLLDTKKNLTEICGGVQDDCINSVMLYQTWGNGWYDIGHPKHDPFPAPNMYGYLLEAEVLSSLGVPVNYSESSGAVGRAFGESYDIILGGFGESIGYLLDNGVKVHMMYGDRDYACNWVGGERASLAVPYNRSEDFARAGYAPLITPDGITGMTRQFGNYSFSRVYQAGHEVPSYQPVTAYEIFMRATFNRDVATGLIPVTDELATEGPRDIWHIKNKPPAQPDEICYVLKPETCRPEVWQKVVDGTAMVRDYYVVGVDGDDASGQISEEL